MKNIYLKRFVIFLLICIMIFSFSGCVETNQEKKLAVVDDEEWDELDPNCLYYQSKEEFENAVNLAAEEIAAYVGYADWTEKYAGENTVIHIYFDDGNYIDLAYYANGETQPCLHFKTLTVEYGFPSIYNLTTAAIFFGEISSPSLSAGFPVYMQWKFSQAPTIPNWGVDINIMAKNYRDSGLYINEYAVVGTNEKFYADTLSSSRAVYIMSASFIQYLIDGYGFDEFLSVLRSNDVETAYEDVYGKQLYLLKGEWVDWLQSFPTMSIEEIGQAQEDALAEYGFIY